MNLFLNDTDIDLCNVNRWILPQVPALERRMQDASAPIRDNPYGGPSWLRLHQRATALFEATYNCVMPERGLDTQDLDEYQRLRRLIGVAEAPALRKDWFDRMESLSRHGRMREAEEALASIEPNVSRALRGDSPRWPQWSSGDRASGRAQANADHDQAEPARAAPHGVPGPYHVQYAPPPSPPMPTEPPKGADLAAELGFDGAQASIPGHYSYIKSLGRGSRGAAGLWYKYDD